MCERAQRLVDKIRREDPHLSRNAAVVIVVEVDGQLVGMQDLIAEGLHTFRLVTTFSWLVAAMRGRGVGGEMRSASLHFLLLDSARERRRAKRSSPTRTRAS